MRIALVNDLGLALEALQRVLALEPRHTIAWIARNGEEAVRRTAQDRPDLILMDLLMPGMDGVEATRRITGATPCPILVVTGSVNDRPGLVYEALGHGAVDAISLPNLYEPPQQTGAALLRRIRQIELLCLPASAPTARQQEQAPNRNRTPLIAIGASTGGPRALADCLAPLPANLPAAVLVAQHIEAQFAPGLASWLDQQIALPVHLAHEGQLPQPGMVLLAGTNDHLILSRNGHLHYSPEPHDEPYRPSVNALFHSLLRAGHAPGLAVLLTGMGRDGADGLLALRQAGWFTIAQSAESCAVYGMPRAAVELKAACEQLNPPAIAASLLKRLQTR